MKLCFGLLLALIAGCNQFRPLKGIRDISPGQTSLHEALQILSDPQHITTLPGGEGTIIYHWEEVSLQVDHKIVQAVFRPPAKNEKSFLYWRHAYRNSPTNLQKLNGSDQWQLSIPSEGLAVIYDGMANEVTKVVLYETR
ncbi:MAG: hypothetical protein K2P81_15520 [Bacteriovoracaceae bacterium]|nr:hypothetical protein [Bacteriovoracaceae bacterium]